MTCTADRFYHCLSQWIAAWQHAYDSINWIWRRKKSDLQAESEFLQIEAVILNMIQNSHEVLTRDRLWKESMRHQTLIWQKMTDLFDDICQWHQAYQVWQSRSWCSSSTDCE